MERTGCRRLLALIRNLPQDCASARPEERWTQQDELLATIAEAVDASARGIVESTVTVWTGKQPKLGKPLRITHPGRPGSEPPPVRRVSLRELSDLERKGQ